MTNKTLNQQIKELMTNIEEEVRACIYRKNHTLRLEDRNEYYYYCGRIDALTTVHNKLKNLGDF